jgi:cell division transport system permease protein
MVSLQFDPRGPPAKGALEAALKTAGIDGVVDDHSLWIADIVRAGARARIAAISVAALIALAAGAVIAFATRAGLAARSDIVEVLHITGAKDSYIMGLFQSRLAELAGLAGAIGAAAAALVAAAARLMGGGEGLTPVLPIAWTDLLAVLPVPLIAAAVAAVAARLTAMRLIGELP